MGKKQKHEEHVNLERYLVSYADFMTLLFATFVVLYALSQVDISEYTKLEESLKQAFASPSLLQGSEGVMSDGSTIFEGGSTDSTVPPILEYVSAKYEQDSFDQIQKDINEMEKAGELDGVNASIDERGLVIKFSDNSVFFNPGSADLTSKAIAKLSKTGVLLSKKFATHMIRVEGHTDSEPVTSRIYPSNWELSTARASTIVKFLIKNYKFRADRFSAIGYADTRPIAENKNSQGRAKNRRVEIVVLRNKYMTTESGAKGIMDIKKSEVTTAQQAPLTPATERKIEDMHKDMNISSAAQNLMKEQKLNSKNVVILNDTYNQESKRIEDELKKMEQHANNKIYAQSNETAPVEKIKPVSSKTFSIDNHTKPVNSAAPAVHSKVPAAESSPANDHDLINRLIKENLFDKLKK